MEQPLLAILRWTAHTSSRLHSAVGHRISCLWLWCEVSVDVEAYQCRRIILERVQRRGSRWSYCSEHTTNRDTPHYSFKQLQLAIQFCPRLWSTLNMGGLILCPNYFTKEERNSVWGRLSPLGDESSRPICLPSCSSEGASYQSSRHRSHELGFMCGGRVLIRTLSR